MGDSEHGGDHARLERIEAKLDRVLAFLGESGGGDSLRKVLGDIILTQREIETLEANILDILKASQPHRKAAFQFQIEGETHMAATAPPGASGKFYLDLQAPPNFDGTPGKFLTQLDPGESINPGFPPVPPATVGSFTDNPIATLGLDSPAVPDPAPGDSPSVASGSWSIDPAAVPGTVINCKAVFNLTDGSVDATAVGTLTVGPKGSRTAGIIFEGPSGVLASTARNK